MYKATILNGMKYKTSTTTNIYPDAVKHFFLLAARNNLRLPSIIVPLHGRHGALIDFACQKPKKNALVTKA